MFDSNDINNLPKISYVLFKIATQTGQGTPLESKTQISNTNLLFAIFDLSVHFLVYFIASTLHIIK